MSEITIENNKTVVVGMSGGVDSSVTALLLKQKGFRVIGLFMKNWDEKDDNGQCTSSKDYDDVALTCAHIGIPFRSVNFVKEYREQVFEHFLEEYQAGYTPNPDILCNREIKFNVFFKKARELGADFLATGHYCRVVDGQLYKGLDPQKDQSYFLNAINGSVLNRVLFPIGELHKQEVRAIAAKNGLPTHAKKDSTGICFIGERHFVSFLSQYISVKPGPFKRLDGKTVGEHSGVAYYTLGQRRQLGLGGPGERWYVVAKDNSANIVYVERGDEHPALFCDELIANEVSWINEQARSFPLPCTAKVRYRQMDQACEIEPMANGRMKVRFQEAQRAIAPRQSIAFYHGDRCLGGGMIETAGPSYFEMDKPLH
ncbi:MAG: tRNA 2-thiouridine(34) synthase MnmA [Oligoflexales bacterium]